MQWISADIVFDGFDFHSSLFLFVDDEGMILHKQKEKPDGDVRHLTGMIMPGMINAHCHLELSDMLGKIDAGIGLVDFLRSVNELNQKDKKKIEKEVKQEAIFKADNEMYQNGIVAVGDICNNIDTIACKTDSKLYYHSFVEAICVNPEQVENRFFHYSNVLYEFQQQLSASLALHAPYSCCDELFEEVSKRSSFITIHNQESNAENTFFQMAGGDFLEFLEGYGFFHSQLLKGKLFDSSFIRTQELLESVDKKLYVHNTFTQASDIVLERSNAYWCFCPKANLYIENKLPDFSLYARHQENIVLGTDSLASNNSLNILDEMFTIQKNNPAITLKEMLRWATSNAAQLFDLEEVYGSFALGNTPGIVHVPGMIPDTLKLTDAQVERII